MTETTAITTADLVEIEGDARIHDLRLGERLGFRRPRAIRQIIERNYADLERYGGLPHRVANPGARGGRPTKEYHLNEGQILRLCTLSETPIAADITFEVISVYQAWRQGKLGPSADMLEQMRRMFEEQSAAMDRREAGILAKVVEMITHQNQASTNYAYVTAYRVIEDRKIPVGNRNGLSRKLANALVRHAKVTGQDKLFLIEQVNGKDVRKFDQALVAEVMAKQGDKIIADHVAKYSDIAADSQGALNLVQFPRKK